MRCVARGAVALYAAHEESCRRRVGGLRDVAGRYGRCAALPLSPMQQPMHLQQQPLQQPPQQTHTASADAHASNVVAMGIPVDSHILWRARGRPAAADYELGPRATGALFGVPMSAAAAAHEAAAAATRRCRTNAAAGGRDPPRLSYQQPPLTPHSSSTASAGTSTAARSPVRRSPSGRQLMDPHEAAAAGAAAAASAPQPPAGRAAVYALPGESVGLLASGTTDDAVGHTDMVGVAPGSGAAAAPRRKSIGSKVKGFFKRLFDRD